jgi:hypothetical protein
MCPALHRHDVPESRSSSCQIVWKRASGGELFSGWFGNTNPVVVFSAGINLG